MKNCSENAIPEISPHNATCKYVGVIGLFFRRPQNFAIPENKTPFVSAEKMRILSATTAKLQRECKDPSVLLWIHSENAIFFASETIEQQKL